MMDMKSPFAIALANVPHFGHNTLRRLFEAFSNMEDAWKATGDELLGAGVRPQDLSKFFEFRTAHDPSKFVAIMEHEKITAVSMHDENYPQLLKTIIDPPAMFFLKGELPSSSKNYLAVVGSRHASQYGFGVAKDLVFTIAQAGVVIVSGGAYGIDETAHRAAITANGKTIAVLGCGLLAMDNPDWVKLTDDVLASGGAVISEFPFASVAQKFHFPLRNRIVSGLCQATLVVEAGLPSGSLITAQSTLDQNRELLAVPGPITSFTSKGTNNLIRTGCHVALEAADIFHVLSMDVVPTARATATLPPNRSPDEIALFAQFSAEPLHLDTAIAQAGIDPVKGSVATTQLEILGVIIDVGGKRFVRG